MKLVQFSVHRVNCLWTRRIDIGEDVKQWKRVGDTDVCVELLSSRLSIDNLLLNTYSAYGRRKVHLATTSPTQRSQPHLAASAPRFESSLFCDVASSSTVVAYTVAFYSPLITRAQRMLGATAEN